MGWRFGVGLLAIGLFGIVDGGRERAAADVIRSRSVQCQALGGDLRYSVYLPPAFDAGRDRPYPVVFLLHGIAGSDTDWADMGDVEAILDELIATGVLPPMVAIMPGAGSSWYLDSRTVGGPGDYATAIVRDLRLHVEKTYNVGTHRSDRAIAGLSMGGFGALHLGFAYPDLFVHVGSYSPTLFWQAGDIDRMTRRETLELMQEFGSGVPQSFFDAASPYGLLPAFLASKTPPTILLAAGDDDRLSTVEYAYDLRRTLLRLSIPVEYRVVDGGHDWKVWRAAFREDMHHLGAGHWASLPRTAAKTAE